MFLALWRATERWSPEEGHRLLTRPALIQVFALVSSTIVRAPSASGSV
jgi:hypothetical protein